MSFSSGSVVMLLESFNPRPPKRTLCPKGGGTISQGLLVSIHVLRRGRCVVAQNIPGLIIAKFQSTSSEEDVVSNYGTVNVLRDVVSIHVLRRGRCVLQHGHVVCLPRMFQSTSSEEDVVSLC